MRTSTALSLITNNALNKLPNGFIPIIIEALLHHYFYCLFEKYFRHPDVRLLIIALN